MIKTKQKIQPNHFPPTKSNHQLPVLLDFLEYLIHKYFWIVRFSLEIYNRVISKQNQQYFFFSGFLKLKYS